MSQLRIGDEVPDVGLIDEHARPWALSEQRGHGVLLVLHRHLA